MNNLAPFYRALGRYREAEPLYAAALPLLEPETGGIWNNLAELYRSEVKYDKAESAARTSLTLAEAADGPDSASVASSLHTLAAVCEALKRYDEALGLLDR